MAKDRDSNQTPITGLMGDILASTNKTAADILNEKSSVKKESGASNPKKSSLSFPAGQKSAVEEKILNTPYVLKKVPRSNIERWSLANRLYLTEESCGSLIESIKRQGQQQPVIVRKKGKKYELISGSRRLFACNYLKIDVLALIVDVTNKEALVLMDLENREREDISPYERGMDYKRWIKEGVYKNYAQIVEATGIKKNLLSQIVALADLDKKLAGAFKTPFLISIKWGYALKTFLDKNKLLLPQAIEAANKGLDAKGVLREINQSESHNAIQVIKNVTGKEIVKLKKSKTGKVSMTFNKALPQEKLDSLIKWLSHEL